MLGVCFLSSISSLIACWSCFYFFGFVELLFSKCLNISLRLRVLGWHWGMSLEVCRMEQERHGRKYNVVGTLLFPVLVIIKSEVTKKGNVGSRPMPC